MTKANRLHEIKRFDWLPNNIDVFIRCLTYNHVSFINQALDGFIIQKTNFPFIAVIIDDCSIDGEQKVISDYMINEFDFNNNPYYAIWESDIAKFILAKHLNNSNCYFHVILLKQNLRKKPDLKKKQYYDLIKNCSYQAECEGDDYWTDPNKLQMQIDFLDSHPYYSMVCCRAKMFSMKSNSFRPKDNFCRHGDGDLNPKEIIRRGGYYIPTCSITYRQNLQGKDYPDYCRKSPVGDYPLQIWLAMKGKVYYFDAPMAVYRVDNPSAWSGKKDALNSYSEKDLDAFRRQVDMLKGFAKDYPQYSKPCVRRAEFFINSKFRSCHAKDPENQKVLNYFKEDIKQFGILGRIDKRMRLCGNKKLLILYYATVFKWLFHNYLDKFW